MKNGIAHTKCTNVYTLYQGFSFNFGSDASIDFSVLGAMGANYKRNVINEKSWSKIQLIISVKNPKMSPISNSPLIGKTFVCIV